MLSSGAGSGDTGVVVDAAEAVADAASAARFKHAQRADDGALPNL